MGLAVPRERWNAAWWRSRSSRLAVRKDGDDEISEDDSDDEITTEEEFSSEDETGEESDDDDENEIFEVPAPPVVNVGIELPQGGLDAGEPEGDLDDSPPAEDPPPVEPAAPAEPAEVTEPAAEPVEPTQPAEPAEPAEPVEPVQPIIVTTEPAASPTQPAAISTEPAASPTDAADTASASTSVEVLPSSSPSDSIILPVSSEPGAIASTSALPDAATTDLPDLELSPMPMGEVDIGAAVGIVIGTIAALVILLLGGLLIVRWRRDGHVRSLLPPRFHGSFVGRSSSQAGSSAKVWKLWGLGSSRSSATSEAGPEVPAKKTNTAIIDQLTRAAYDAEQGSNDMETTDGYFGGPRGYMDEKAYAALEGPNQPPLQNPKPAAVQVPDNRWTGQYGIPPDPALFSPTAHAPGFRDTSTTASSDVWPRR